MIPKPPVLLLALHAINGATTDEALDDIRDLCVDLWEKTRPDMMDACDLAILEEDIDLRRAALAGEAKA